MKWASPIQIESVLLVSIECFRDLSVRKTFCGIGGGKWGHDESAISTLRVK